MAESWDRHFNWDILNYGRIRNNVRRYEARFQQAAIDYQQTVLNADKEVEKALIAFLKAQERAAELQGAVDATRKSVDLAVIQYREGAIDFERIFNLQNVLVRQQIDQARARAEISLSLIDVYRALRGGWQIRLGHAARNAQVAVAGQSGLPAGANGIELLPAVNGLPAATNELAAMHFGRAGTKNDAMNRMKQPIAGFRLTALPEGRRRDQPKSAVSHSARDVRHVIAIGRGRFRSRAPARGLCSRLHLQTML